MKKVFFCITLLFLLQGMIEQTKAQTPNDANAAPVSGNATAASKFENTPVNYFTGIPSISVPIYNYSHSSGIGVDISLDYFAGGTKLNETPSVVGLGWNLNAGGSVSRTVRGMPDDLPTNGYLYAAAIPADYRPNGRKYYRDSLDAEQDIFQFNFNGRSGKFFIGKNGQIVTVPLSKLKITYTTSSSLINTFTITAEDGTRYSFAENERIKNSVSLYKCGYGNTFYTSAWYLTKITAPFGTDNISFTYTTFTETDKNIAYPQNVYVPVSGGANILNKPTGTQTIEVKKLVLITTPDKNVQFRYSDLSKYDGLDSSLEKIIIYDSVLRFGYNLKREFVQDGQVVIPNYAFLTGIEYYTLQALQTMYTFDYNILAYMPPRYAGDTLSNKRDHWGYYNGASNGLNSIPTVSGIYTGADRSPSASLARTYALGSIMDNKGAFTFYTYETNDIFPYTTSAQSLPLTNVVSASSNNVTISQLFSTQNSFSLSFGSAIDRKGIVPFSGTGNLLCSITSLDGLTTFASATISLYEMFYTGIVTFPFNIPNGGYLFKTSLTGTSTGINLPVTVTWENQASAAGNATTSGGVRIKNIVRFSSLSGMDTISSFKYIRTDGKSSGFLTSTPKYDHKFDKSVIKTGGTTTTSYNLISSEPINNLDYSQGSPVGYSRVEVYTGSPTHNLGKKVFEYTDYNDALINVKMPSFPFTPVPLRTWQIGLPKRIAVYDSLGRKVSSTTNTYDNNNDTAYSSSYFTSLALGHNLLVVDSVANPVTNTEYYIGQKYYPESGIALLASSVDSFFHPNSSVTVSTKTIQYDTFFNPIKITTPYDITRGLSLERRLYYPYNYTVAGTIKKLKDSAIQTLVSSESWITGDATPRILSAQITDFQQLAKGYIRPLYTYALQSLNPVPQSTITVFNPALLVRNSTYLIKQQAFSTFDTSGNPLEVQNAITGQYASQVYDQKNTVIAAKVSNAKYTDIAFTSFEGDGNGNWSVGSTARDNTNALTGNRSYDLDSGNITKTGLTAATTYIITYWKKNSAGGTVTVSNATGSTLLTSQNGWDLYTQTLTGQTSVTVSGTSLIDELRLYPKDAYMSTSTIDASTGITSSSDAGNTVTYFDYDKLDRQNIIKDRNKNILKKIQSSDVFAAISAAPKWQARDTCQLPLNGKMDACFLDTNSYSFSYRTIKLRSFKEVNCACKPPCPVAPDKKLINCSVCETGVMVVTSCSQILNHGVPTGQWTWIYHYEWSDGSSSTTYSGTFDDSCL